jgi:hypothetical protein
MQADSALSNLLAKPLQVQMTRRQDASVQLRLVSPSDGTLKFTGEPTPESLYGPGTTVFLEIAAQSVACPNPPSPNTSRVTSSACENIVEARKPRENAVCACRGPAYHSYTTRGFARR